MSDTFLENFEARRAARAQADRTFSLAGETLTYRASVAPEVGFRLQAMRRDQTQRLAELKRRIAEANGQGVDPSALDILITDEETIQVCDETVLACLEEDSREPWGRLRAVDAGQPLTFEEVIAVTDYVLARVAGIPTDAPADSSAGRKTTRPKSKARSSSPATTQTA